MMPYMDRARIRRDTGATVKLIWEAVDILAAAGGGSFARRNKVLNRIWQDARLHRHARHDCANHEHRAIRPTTVRHGFLRHEGITCARWLRKRELQRIARPSWLTLRTRHSVGYPLQPGDRLCITHQGEE